MLFLDNEEAMSFYDIDKVHMRALVNKLKCRESLADYSILVF